jgi:hypothetical protein
MLTLPLELVVRVIAVPVPDAVNSASARSRREGWMWTRSPLAKPLSSYPRVDERHAEAERIVC